MRFENDKFGARIIETITSGLYDGNLNCLREYVQNSIDAEADKIEIYFENGRRDLIIKDNGFGMNGGELAESLSIGISNKLESDVGWRGIGIWSGVPICRRIVIITKKRNSKKYRIETDNDKLRREVGSNKPVLDVLTESTGEIEELEMSGDESSGDFQFTVVRLESILPTQVAIFNDRDIHSYLSRVVPAPFNLEEFPLAKEVNEKLKENGVEFPKVDIIFQNNRIYRPPDRTDIFFMKPIYKEFKVKGETIAFGWFLTTNQNSKLRDPNNGIYFKKKGFTIGDKNLVIKQHIGTYHEWQYGEIHVISHLLRENAPRNNFEFNNDIVDGFLTSVGEFIKELERMNHYQSDRVVSKHVKRMENCIEREDFQSARVELKRIREKSHRNPRFPEDRSLEGMKKVIDSKFGENLTDASRLESETEKEKSDYANLRKQLDSVIEGLPAALKKHMKKTSRHARLEPEISVTKEIAKLLKQRTGATINEMRDLTKIAYGWNQVSGGGIGPKLTLTNGINQHRDRLLGVMIFAIHDLFVNTFKHEEGKPEFEWFEGCTEEEKYDIISGMYATLGLVYRLIERSKIC